MPGLPEEKFGVSHISSIVPKPEELSQIKERVDKIDRTTAGRGILAAAEFLIPFIKKENMDPQSIRKTATKLCHSMDAA